ncbi:MAG: double-strand break repair helicase AddA [Parvularculaceae bacterium]
MTPTGDIIAETTRAQSIAANPDNSAFVSANAGSGKTRVLTNRVARLLLRGVAPNKILCITFTKAAAAEMNSRLLALLGGWALAPSEKLVSALEELEGDHAKLTEKDLNRARRLFARALETPGGLKIQTIHSFCERVLRKFPIEAGIAPGFTVLDEEANLVIAEKSIDRALTASTTDRDLAEAFNIIGSIIPGTQLKFFLRDCIVKNRREFEPILFNPDGLGVIFREFCAHLGCDPSTSVTEYADDAAVILSALDWNRVRKGLARGPKTSAELAIHVDRYLAASNTKEAIEAATALFCTKSGTPRKKLLGADVARASPDLLDSIVQVQDAFLKARIKILSATIANQTHALWIVLKKCAEDFVSLKFASASLDFDDLINLTRRLFSSDAGTSWAMYKLDQEVEHILLDEAQDTSPAAWRVIEGPLREFFAQTANTENVRTFFAVGDKKQSIYSFQGADAALFAEKQIDLGKLASTTGKLENIPLKASFRTVEPILKFVDALFARDEVAENVSDERPLTHLATRGEDPGLVEIWPLAPRDDIRKTEPWDAPLDAILADNPMRKLARQIAQTISTWLAAGEFLESQNRPIRPDDILILVQSRGALFHETIRELTAHGVPVAGADRMKLTDSQAVLDLLSYARAVTTPDDSLSFAETLKTPMFGFTDDDLIELGANRTQPSLYGELCTCKDENALWCGAWEKFERARSVGLSEGAVAFFYHVLDTEIPSGWFCLNQRLGPTAKEPVEELIRHAFNHEAVHPRGIRSFLASIEKMDADIVRDMDESGKSVRVMTVHKSKGLEGNIVFVLDSQRRPPKTGDAILQIQIDNKLTTPALMSGGRTADIPEIITAKEEAKRRANDEYRRLLYVAVTRARDRLYICGHEVGNAKASLKKDITEKNWHELALDAFTHLGVVSRKNDMLWEMPVLQVSNSHKKNEYRQKNKARTYGKTRGAVAALPDFLRSRIQPSPTPRLFAPSTSGLEESAPAEKIGGRTRGKTIHLLLETIPQLPEDRWDGAIDQIFESFAESISENDRTHWKNEVLRILRNLEFAQAFGPESLAEVPISGMIKINGRQQATSGVIDRLAVLEDRILLIDFKTNRTPPNRVEDTPGSYLFQIAAYRDLLKQTFPEKPVKSGILWTFVGQFMPLPDELLDEAIVNA